MGAWIRCPTQQARVHHWQCLRDSVDVSCNAKDKGTLAAEARFSQLNNGHLWNQEWVWKRYWDEWVSFRGMPCVVITNTSPNVLNTSPVPLIHPLHLQGVPTSPTHQWCLQCIPCTPMCGADHSTDDSQHLQSWCVPYALNTLLTPSLCPRHLQTQFSSESSPAWVSPWHSKHVSYTSNMYNQCLKCTSSRPPGLIEYAWIFWCCRDLSQWVKPHSSANVYTINTMHHWQ